MRPGGYYVMRDGVPVEVGVREWATAFGRDRDNRIVERTKVGDVLVSTVFLGLDHNFTDEGPPILWETLVFGGPLNEEMYRYTSLEDAKAGHAAMVQRVKERPGAEKGGET